MVRNPYAKIEKMIGGFSNKKPKTRKPISKASKNHVWNKYMGNRIQGKCYCCKIIPIHFQNFEIGHNKSVYSGGTNHINNLRPICRDCNRKMGKKSIEWYKKKYFDKPTPKKPGKKRRRKSSRPKTSFDGSILGNLSKPSKKNPWGI